MFTFFLHQCWFIIVLFGLFFVPGWVLLRATFDRSRFSLPEWSLLSATTSIALINFTLLSLNFVHVRFTPLSLWIVFIFEILLFAGAVLIRKRHALTQETENTFIPSGFSSRQTLAVLSILVLTVFIKTVYLVDAGVPSSTDMGHHMFWAKTIAVTGSIPPYVESNIIEKDGQYVLEEPQPIADFIIGEHLPFTALSLMSGANFISSFPIIVLFLINLLSSIALAILSWRLWYRPAQNLPNHTSFAVSVTIITLLLAGPLYALSSPQAKYISGGVIGNTFGNFFIPVLLLVYYRAFKEKDSRFLTLAFFLTFGLAYIHHLSTLVFLFAATASLLVFCIIHWRRIGHFFRTWLTILLRPAPLIFIGLAIIFFFFVHTPSYARLQAVDTALGSPSKDTRTGLTLAQFADSTGYGRFGLGLVGFAFLVISKNRRRYAGAFLIGWSAILFIMATRPQWVLIDIPSNRISTYAIFPFILLGAWLVAKLTQYTQHPTVLPRFSDSLTALAIGILSVATLSSGLFDNSKTLLNNEKAQETVETFAASEYLAQHTDTSDLVLKDHNYIVADSWMKLFFLRGYSYPLSRGYFKRYDDVTKPREQCTLWMISIPNTPKGQKCFNDTGTDFLVVNSRYDSAQFTKSPEFSLVYTSDDISVYYRNKAFAQNSNANTDKP